ncbi:hypothetical protein VM1G_06831 [Cytospora mali]|uniref:Transmembrane protein n=1 Tax=Cytospora mali TaxID=578113 RepID=A0A194W523_CYTMA|nr:hypothetical protein VM1G_06831 [Valsa mali]
MASSEFSAEFIAYAKEEDAINHQHSSNWIFCYVLITFILFGFIGCAWWSNSHKAAKMAKPVPKFARRNNNTANNPKGQTENIEMRDLEAARTTTAATATATARTRTPRPVTTWAGKGSKGKRMTAMMKTTTTTTTTATTTTTTAPPPPRARAESVSSDTGAGVGVGAGGSAFEDVDLERNNVDQRGRDGPRPSWLRRVSRPASQVHHPVPAWRRRTVFPAQPEGGMDWPRYEGLVLVQLPGNHEGTA